MSLPQPFLPSKKRHSKLSFNPITEAGCLSKHREIRVRLFSFNLQTVMSLKKAAAGIRVPATKYCTGAVELSGLISGFTPMWDPMYVKGKMSRVILKVKNATSFTGFNLVSKADSLHQVCLAAN